MIKIKLVYKLKNFKEIMSNFTKVQNLQFQLEEFFFVILQFSESKLQWKVNKYSCYIAYFNGSKCLDTLINCFSPQMCHTCVNFFIYHTFIHLYPHGTCTWYMMKYLFLPLFCEQGKCLSFTFTFIWIGQVQSQSNEPKRMSN